MTDERQTRAAEVASFKALDNKAGTFEALVSVFGNVDNGGDRVIKGAFSKSLNRWREKGDPIPFMWNHMWDNPEAFIGEIDPDDAVETGDGLVVKGRIDTDKPFARQVYDLLTARRLKEFSFGYSVKDAERKNGALDLLEVDLFEVSTTFKGMNPDTELLAVKALAAVNESDMVPAVQLPPPAETKAGARLSKETRAALARARDEIDALLAVDLGDESPKSDEAEALGKASDPDAEFHIQLKLMKERTRVRDQ